jgi:hypothetical protein
MMPHGRVHLVPAGNVGRSQTKGAGLNGASLKQKRPEDKGDKGARLSVLLCSAIRMG